MKKYIILSLILLVSISFSGCSIGSWFGEGEISQEYSLKEKSIQELMNLAKSTKDIELLTILSKHKNEGVRSDVAKNPALPSEVQKKLVLDKDWLVRNYLGANPKIDEEVANILMADTDQRVRWTVAKNPNTPESVMMELADDKSPQVLLKLVTNDGLTEAVMIKAAETIPATVAIEMLKREDITKAVLDVLRKRNDEKIQKALQDLENPETNEFPDEQ